MTKELKKRLLPKVKTSITYQGKKVSTQLSVKHKTKFEHQNNLFETINIHMLTIKDKNKNVQSKKKLKKSGIFIYEDYCEKNWNCERLFGKSFCSIGSKTK